MLLRLDLRIAAPAAARLRRFGLVVSAAVAVAASLGPKSALAWGERASVDDLFEMNSDYSQLLASQAVLQVPAGLLEAERRRLLAQERSSLPGSIGDMVRDALDRAEPFDWQAMILSRLPEVIASFKALGLRIIRNPSSSCAVSASVLARIFAIERQLVLLGAGGALLSRDDPEDAQPPLFHLVAEVETLCIEDAYDHCLASGSVLPFFSMAASFSRQMALLGIDEKKFVGNVAQRMQDCGRYELEVKVVTVTHTGYPRNARYTSTMRGTFRAKLRLEFWEEPETAFDLRNAVFVTLVASGFDFVPQVECVGREEKLRCIPKPQPNGLGQPGDVEIEFGDFQVKYKTMQAEANPNARPGGGVLDCRGASDPDSSASPGFRHQPIRFCTYEPPVMDRDRLVIKKFVSPSVEFEVERIDGSPLRDDSEEMAFAGKPVEDWQRESVAHEGLVFSKIARTHADPRHEHLGTPTNPKLTDESAQLKLTHKPFGTRRRGPVSSPPQ